MANEGTLNPILKGYLFAADRYIRMKSISKEDMKSKILLFDRYVPSALAYRMAEVVDILEDYRANNDKGKKVEYDPEF